LEKELRYFTHGTAGALKMTHYTHSAHFW